MHSKYIFLDIQLIKKFRKNCNVKKLYFLFKENKNQAFDEIL